MAHRILVLGATGKTGTELVRHLSKAGRQAIAAVRNPDAAASQFAKAGIPLDAFTMRTFDYCCPHTWEQVLKGVQALYLIAPPKSLGPDPAKSLLDLALSKDIEHVTMLSGATTGDVPGSLLYEIEEYVRTLPCKWTILRPSWFMQNMVNWLGAMIRTEGRFYTPAGTAQTAMIDVRDVVCVAAATFDGKWDHHVLTLTGPEAINYDTVARLISVATGTLVNHISLEDDEFQRLMVEEYGWDPGTAAATVDLFRLVRSGKEARVTQEVAQVLGRPPKSFREFARDHRDAWR